MLMLFMSRLTPVYLRSFSRFGKVMAILGFLSLAMGIYGGLYLVPADYQQGDVFRIIYMHVPASWSALSLYMIMAICFAVGLISQQKMWLLLAQGFGVPGLAFCVLSLVSGAIWGRPTWGSYWVWDARLTAMLILMFIYLGVFQLCILKDEKSLKAAALLAIMGAINIPIIKWSVNWWFTLHQPASITLSLRSGAESAVHSTMLWPLLLSYIGFMVYGVGIALHRFRNALQEQKQIRDAL